MGIATAVIANAEDFQRVLKTKHPVFLLFVSQHCPACGDAGPLFELIASKYPWIVSMVLDCAEIPRHPEVTGTPTLLVYLDGALMEKTQGLRPGRRPGRAGRANLQALRQGWPAGQTAPCTPLTDVYAAQSSLSRTRVSNVQDH